jgi:ketosteroid isomerase-like protein
LIRALRQGDEKSVPQLMELWDPDGVFEFAGAPPVVGTYKGAVAIHSLYKNRVGSGNMPVPIETRSGQPIDMILGVVDTEVTHLRTNGNRVIVGWRTTVGTREGVGFDVAGSHLFTFEGNKIKSLRVNVSPKADQSQLAHLKFEDLTVADVGRLSLAAWAVV